MSRLKSRIQPNTVFISDKPALAVSFARLSMNSWGDGSSGWLLRTVAWIASSAVQHFHIVTCWRCSAGQLWGGWCRRHTSFIPLGLIGMLTISSFPSPNCMSLSIVIGIGTRCWIGECRSHGFQLSSCNKTFAMSHRFSQRTPLAGTGRSSKSLS